MTSAIDSSLHQPSPTRWSAKLKAVKPFKNNVHKLASCLKQCLPQKLTPKVKSEVNGAIKYVTSFECILMSCMWEKILGPIDACNNAIQCRDATLDGEVVNLESCMRQLNEADEKWHEIIEEATEIANAAKIDPKLTEKRANVSLTDTQRLAVFKETVWDKILAEVKKAFSKRFQSVNNITSFFSFLWSYKRMTEGELKRQCSAFAQFYTDVDQEELADELKSLKRMHEANFGELPLPPLKLLNKIVKMGFDQLFPYITISLRIFLTLPVTVASAERSFSKLKLIKNHLRSLMGQQRLVDLVVMGIESDLTRKADFQELIDAFAYEKARKVLLKSNFND